jgi:hypothetical protein
MKRINDIHKKNNFAVPEGYFDKIEMEVSEKFFSEQAELSKVSLLQMLKPYMYVAIFVLMLVSGVQLLLKNVVKKDSISIFEEKSDFDQHEIIYLFDDDVIIEYLIETQSETDENQIGCENIENYLSHYYIEYEFFDK